MQVVTCSKGQMSFLSKPVMLVMTIAVLIVLLQTVWSTPAKDKEQELTLRLMTKASEILDILLSSEDCLAMRANTTQSAYAYVASKDKLDEFAKSFALREPDCARNFEYSYSVVIDEQCGTGEECLRWAFGSPEFSPSSDLLGKQQRSLPVGIMHSKKDIRVGKATITLADGALERISGFLDKACMLHEDMSMDITFSEKLMLSGNEACLGSSCKSLDCRVDERSMPAGGHNLRISFKSGAMEVSG